MSTGQEFYRGALSINKDAKSPYWMVTFVGVDGRKRRRSTKVPVKGGEFEGVKITAKLAEKLAYQRGVQIACAEEREYKSENNVTVREWGERCISRKAGRVAEATTKNSRTALKHFCEYLGRKADEPLRLVTRDMLKGFIEARREVVRYETVGKDMEYLNYIFAEALDAEVIAKNPCVRLKIPPDRSGEKLHKEAFSVEEIRYMIEKFPPAWSSAVRCSFETFGQRLGDILNLDWSQFDWQNRVVRFVTGKTGRVLAQPMRAAFYDWARARWEAEGCPATGFLHPSLRRLGSQASYQFGLLLRTHEIGLLHGDFGGRRRVMNSKSFHSIRATCATLLQSSGVSQGLAMELVGHESEQIHAVYIRPTVEQLRAAAEKLPGV